ncbi:hypothetical protein PENSPDRAFT_651509 [Peniophora sp. CONT]|nr:hypothetical protein PENSPDRAFT_651509 [Peniophora sp. CONT]
MHFASTLYTLFALVLAVQASPVDMANIKYVCQVPHARGERDELIYALSGAAPTTCFRVLFRSKDFVNRLRTVRIVPSRLYYLPYRLTTSRVHHEAYATRDDWRF